MTKVSMRHLNELVRERNQYSRDAMEAWQDFINLKGRMDTELTKVTKRNNFLVEELETWKQQFLKFQAFAEQLTKETSELKVKIENHKRENRRLTGLIDQQKDDVARLTLRLSGTEKQRDDALEALVLQQEIAEELERERKRNQKELSSLQHSNSSLSRQRDDAQRVVLHLRSLINGQTHHMEHIVRSIGSSAELSELVEQEVVEENEAQEAADVTQEPSVDRSTPTKDNMRDMNPELEQHLLNIGKGHRRLARLSITDVADRYLRDKTDAISDIIRSISEQCAAAVEGLHLAQDAEDDEDEDTGKAGRGGSHVGLDLESRRTHSPCDGSEIGDGENNSLHPDHRGSSVPPTPDLVHNRSSTSMSMVSSSTFPERSSQQYGPGEIPTRIVEDDDERIHETDGIDDHTETGTLSKQASETSCGPPPDWSHKTPIHR
ncbi:DENN (AEX-3) domain protein [Aspergillus ochraceoroseus]|uniref:DENN (AEX-3) domain protein n=1 Tax=Aspergillus ochraceoroseus TaxID=138278 RepID=A0A0F8X111_9EURO|nr:DENN (AEX-3) domain protein [Aspergillus ochraceoroseus]